METLSRNLDALRSRDPDLAERLARCRPGPEVERVIAPGGAPSVRVDGRLEASAEDPEEDGRAHARQFLRRAEEAGAVRLVVLGLGVHTLRFLEPLPGPVLVVEPSLELCRSVLEAVDLSRALGQVDLVVGPEPGPALRHPVFASREHGLLLVHPAARRRAPGLHEELAQRFSPGGAPTSLDLAVVRPLWGGSLPVAQACARACRELGHRVREIDPAPFLGAYEAVVRASAGPGGEQAGARLRSSLVRLIGDTLLASLTADPPDLVFALAQAPLDPHALAQLRRQGIPSAFWFCEDFRVMTYWRELARGYDTVFHIQPESFSGPLREAGGFGVPLSMGFDPAIHRSLATEDRARERYASPVSFVGAAYHNRVRFLPGLADLGLRIWGTGWPETSPFREAMSEPNVRQTPQASNAIFNATHINLNLHSSPWCDGVNPVGDYLNPRTFELAGAGAFQLVDERSELARCFRPGEEVETYRDLAECRAKIRYYLDHADERQEIAARARRRAEAEHTYRRRMQQALDALRASPVPLVPRGRGSSVEAVLHEAREEPGLAAILQRLAPDQLLDERALSLAVERGEGPLSREERIVLMMRELRGEAAALREAGQTG
jgi:spore maturation protein CgeB